MTTTFPTADQASSPTPRGRSPWLVVGAVLAVLGIIWAAMNISGLLLRQTATESASVASAARLVVDLDSGDIRLTATEGDEVDYQARLVWSYDRPEVQASTRGDVLEISAGCDTEWIGWCEVDLDISVPAGVVVEARTSSGDVRASGLDQGQHCGPARVTSWPSR